VEAETGQGVDGAHGPAGLGKDGDSPGRSGPARRTEPVGLKSEEKIFLE
jgi:hypothetical protein